MKKLISLFFSLILPFNILFAQLTIDSLIATESRCAATGTITVYASGGSLANVYAIIAGPNGYTAPDQSGNVFNALGQGNYTVRVISGPEEVTGTVDVTGDYVIPNPVLTAYPEVCPGTDQGRIQVDVTGGRPPYSYYMLSPPSPVTSSILDTTASSVTFDSLPPGTYSIQVIDSCGNIQTRGIVLQASTIPPLLFLGSNIWNWEKVACDSVEFDLRVLRFISPITMGIVVNGDTTQHSYYEDNPGVYYAVAPYLGKYKAPYGTVQTFVIDGCGRTASGTVTIQPRLLAGGLSGVDCQNEGLRFLPYYTCLPDTTILVNNTTGIAVDTIIRTTGISFAYIEFPNLEPGSYTATTTDCCGTELTETKTVVGDYNIYAINELKGGCDSTALVTLDSRNMQTPLSYSFLSGPASFHNVRSGLGPFSYTYPIDFIGTSRFTYLRNVPPGDYKVSVIDDCGRVDTVEFTVANTLHLVYNMETTHIPGCIGLHSVQFTIEEENVKNGVYLYKVGGGFTPQFEQISATNHEALFTGLSAGTYYTKYTNVWSLGSHSYFGMGCDAIYDTIVIEEYEPPVIVEAFAILCGSGDGIISITADGGVPPYTYSIISGSEPLSYPISQPDSLFTAIPGGTYTVQVLDSCLNSAETSVTISPLDPPNIYFDNEGCGAVTVSADNIPGANYNWLLPDGTTETTRVFTITNFDPSLHNGTYHLDATILSCAATNVDTIYSSPCSTPSVLTQAKDTTVQCDGNGNITALNAWLASNGRASVDTSCSTMTWSNDFLSLVDSCGSSGYANVTFSVADSCGNISTTSATFSIEDTTSPVIVCPVDTTVDCTSAIDTTTLGAATATDNCALDSISYTDVITAGSCPQDYTITRTWTAVDSCGNSTACDQIITVQDTTPPVIVCPVDTTVDCTSAIDTTTLGAATATDNCALDSISYTDVITAGSCPQDYTITRTWTAVDSCGNSTACDQIITVQDTTPPVIVCPVDTTVDCTSAIDTTTLGAATATDNCALDSISYTDVITAGSCPQDYTITRTWTAVDSCGNSTACDQIITVQDTTPPVIVCPVDTTVDCTSAIDTTTLGAATATDNCALDSISYTDVITAGSCPQDYTITRTWTAVDSCGNSTACDQIITVQDTTPPVAVCSDVTLSLDANGLLNIDVSTINNASTDGCGIDTMYLDTYNFDCAHVGDNTVTLTVVDSCGNMSTCQSIVTVQISNACIPTDTIPVVVPEDSTTTVCLDTTQLAGTLTSITSCGDPNSVMTIDPVTYCVDITSSIVGHDTTCVVICDDLGFCDTTIIVITITPVTDTIPMTTPEDSTLSFCMDTLTNLEGGADNVSLCDAGDNGTATVTSLCVDYVPDADYVGSDTLCIITCNAAGLCDTTIIPITITPVTDTIPMTTPEDSTLSFCMDTLTNLEGGADNVSLCDAGDNGTATVTGLCVDYVPDADYVGSDTLCVITCNAAGLCDTTIVPIIITPVNDPPVAVNDINNTLEDMPVEGNVLTNDFDPEADAITINTTPVTDPVNGIVTILPDGSYTYTPDAAFVGKDIFEYVICDEHGLCDTAEVVITVVSTDETVNRPPVGNEDNYQGLPDTDVTGNLITNDYDPDGDILTINTTPVANPTNGTVTINPDGTFTYTPADPTFTGSDEFEYEVCDDGTPSLCDTVMVTIEIVPDNTGNVTYATDDAYGTPEDTPVSGTVLDNDYDPESDTQTVSLVSDVTSGTLTLNPNGTFDYTPGLDYNGPDQFVYSVCDNGMPQACDTATVYLMVVPVNDPPVAVNDINNTLEDMPVEGNVLTNDFDPEGDAITINTTPVTDPVNGIVTILPDGSYTYTPDAAFVGKDIFEYVICDEHGLCDTAEVVITVVSTDETVNRPPVGNEDNYQGLPDTDVTGNLITNDYDPDGDILTINTTPVANPTNGTVTINPDGTFTYTPADPTFTGSDEFEYEVCDDGTPSLCDTVMVTIEIVPDNTGNVTYATDDAYGTPEDTPVSGTVLDNDYDPESDTQTVSLVSDVTGGTLTLNPNGTFDYTPGLDYNGPDQFVYSVCDNGIPQACDTATVYLTVIPVNDPPVAVNDINNTLEDMPVEGNVLTNDFDPEADAITINTTPVTDPVNGIVTILPDGSYTYTPDAGFVGEDIFEYVICDEQGLCDTAEVVITVVSTDETVNRPPAGNEDNYQGLPGTDVTGNLITNDYDPDGDVLTINTTPVTNPTNGTVAINPDGTFTYTPADPTFTGSDEFEYEVCDDGTPSLCDTVLVTLEIIPDNTGNVTYATDDTYGTPEDTPFSGTVLDNDYDPESDTQTVSLVSDVTSGTLTLNPDGTFDYTPGLSYNGPDQFVYSVCDNGIPQACDTATVYLTVIPVNDPPVAVNDINNTLEDMPVEGNVLTNDFDPEADAITINTTPVTDPVNGIVTILPDGSYTYTPDAGFVGEDIFEYVICDEHGLCDTAEVVITVVSTDETVNRPPAGNEDNYQGLPDTDVTGNLITNDYDPDGDVLTINTTPVANPTNGTVTINPDGTFTYTPTDPAFTGSDEFEYEVCDDGTPSLCDTVMVTIEIVPDNTGNVTYATDDTYGTPEDTPVSGTVLDNDYDPESDTQTVSLVSDVTGGTLTLNPNGTFDYTPGLGYNGPDQFVYSVCDNGIPQACDTATVYLMVVPVNDPPVAVNDINNTLEDMPVEGNVLTNDFDPEADAITINTTPVTDPVNGIVTILPDGSYTYTPDAGFVGEDIFEYVICDEQGLCDTAEVVITVVSTDETVNRPPAGNEDNYQGLPGTDVTGNLITNDYDPDGDVLTINTTPVTNPTNGTVAINPDGTFTYTPADPTFTGSDEFEYEVCDDGTPSLCDTVLVTLEIIPDNTGNVTYATDDTYGTPEDTPFSGTVLDNDYDPESDTQTVSLVSDVTSGTLTLNPDGTFDYTPGLSYNGPDQFVYSVCDNGIPQACDTATVYLTVIPVNDPPVAVNDINNTLEDMPVEGNVLTNDFDPEADAITINTTPVTDPVNGIVTILPDGSYTYTPDAGFVGEDIFEYVICDEHGLCDTAEVVITVVSTDETVNRPPAGNEDNYQGLPDTDVTGNLITNDYDPDGDVLTINTTPVANPTNGTVTINPDGTFTYTPTDPAFTGSDEFEYEVCDDGTPSLCDTVMVTIEIVPDNTGNVTYATDDTYGTPEDTPVSGTVLDNDYDPESDTQTVSLVSDVTGGTLTLNPNGTFDYTPGLGYNGPDQFVYSVCDNGIPQACDTATVYLMVVPVNDPPVAVNDINNTLEDMPVEGNVLTNDFDPEADAITINTTPVTDPVNGIVTILPDGSYIYTPDAGFVGEDIFEYVICDEHGLCDTAEVVITVVSTDETVNRPPVGDEDNYQGLPGMDVTGDLIVNDYDPDGDNITINTIPVADPTNGTVTINSDGTFTYIPADPSFTGTETFEYEVCDDGTPSLCDTVLVTIKIIPDNTGNITCATDDVYFTSEDTPVNGLVLDNDYDPEGDSQTSVTLVNDVTNGTLILNADGTFDYTPNADYNGTDQFIYEVCDNGNPLACIFATVYITIFEANLPPVAVDDEFGGTVNDPIDGNVLPNDSDPDGDELEVTTAISLPVHGTLDLNSDGSFTYTPDPAFVGTDQFTYEVCDTAGRSCDTAVVYLTIECEFDKNNLFIPQLVTPNDDGKNDEWVVEDLALLMNCYESNEVIIFNRWEEKVYQKKNYGMDDEWWDGYSTNSLDLKDDELVPAGTYFYILILNGDKQNALTGFIHVQWD